MKKTKYQEQKALAYQYAADLLLESIKLASVKENNIVEKIVFALKEEKKHG